MRRIILFLYLVSVVRAKDICGGTYRGFQYTITSPNYPRDYPHQLNCIYNLEGDEASDRCEQQFHLQFLDFNVKASENCRGDYLQVGDRNVFCGSVVGLRKFAGKNNSLTLKFHTDERDSAKGFKILVTALPCTLKLNPVKNSFIGIKENGFGFNVNGIPSRAYHRGIRGGVDNNGSGDNLATRLTLSPNDVINTSSVTSQSAKGQQESTIHRPQIDFTFEGNTGTDDSLSPPSLLRPTGTTAVKEGNSPQITSYLFLPPTENNATAHKTIASTIKDKSFETVTSPPNDLLPPSRNPVTTFSKFHFPKDHFSTASDKSSSLSGQVQRLAISPSRNYGEPSVGVVDYDIQVANDCDRNTQSVQQVIGTGGSSEKINYDPVQSQGLVSNPNLVYDPRYGFVNANNNPVSDYRPSINNGNFYPGGNYNPGLGLPNYPNYPNYPGGSYNPGLGLPNYPNYPNYPGGSNNPGLGSGLNPVIPNYNPGYNPGYNPTYPGYNPSIGGNYPNFRQGGECCRVQSSRRFQIVSPGFPGGVSTNSYSCVYTITKSSPDVCRLRLNFRFFNFGIDDQNCNNGFIEIDGRRYCGCRTGQSVQVLFADYIAKSITVFYSGYPRTKFSGFLIDVTQESCGISGLNPSYPSFPSYPSSPSFPQNPSYPYDPAIPIYPNYPNYPNYPGYIQRRKDVSNSTSGQRNILKRSQDPSTFLPSPVDPNPHIRNKRDLGYSYVKPSIPFLNKDVQLIPPSVGGATHERIFGGNCQNRIFLDWAIASKEALLRNAICGGYGVPGLNARSYLPPTNNGIISSASTACEEISVIQGVIKSPSYPNHYPSNVNRCYRFNKAPNFCKLEIYVRDFELETSEGCTKDNLSFSTDNKKYCGRSLNDYRTIFDLTQTNSVEMYFSSDSYGTGKGFNVGYSQLPCEATSNF